MKLIGFLVLLSVMAVSPAMAQQNLNRFCGWDAWQGDGRGEFTVETNVRVRNNGECHMRINVSGSDPLTIVQRPSNGTLRLTGAFTFQYVPRAGFVGRDVFSVRNANPTMNSFMTVRYNVTVNPPAQ